MFVTPTSFPLTSLKPGTSHLNCKADSKIRPCSTFWPQKDGLPQFHIKVMDGHARRQPIPITETTPHSLPLWPLEQAPREFNSRQAGTTAICQL